jgi:hypothetical protein
MKECNGKFNVKTLTPENKTFGQFSFITGLPRENQVKALEFCRLYTMSRKDFLKIIK